MLLLNLIRVVITMLGFLLVDTFRRAYGLEGLGLIMVLSLILFLVFVVADVAEEATIRFFNDEDATA